MTNDFDTIMNTIEKMSDEHLHYIKAEVDRILSANAAGRIFSAITTAQNEGFTVALRSDIYAEYVITPDDNIEVIIKTSF